MARLVHITHPDVGPAAGPVTEAAAAHHATRGWQVVGTAEPAPTDPPPAKNASTEDWRTYAIAHGTPEELANEMGRDELVAHYNPEES